MRFPVNMLQRTISAGAALGGVFLTMMMVLIVSNIFCRMAGSVITGSFELSELLIVITASFSLGYAALHESHVDVDIVVSKFSDRCQAGIRILTSFLCSVTWMVTAYASTLIMIERWSTEESEMLYIPFYPFRMMLLVGLILISLSYLTKTLGAIKKVVAK